MSITAMLIAFAALVAVQGTANPTLAPSGATLKPATTKAVAGVDSVRLVVSRLSGSRGVALVSNAVPLVPGALMPEGVPRATLRVEGDDVGAALTATEARHSDGSVKSILIQFQTELLPGDRSTAWLIFGRQTGERSPRSLWKVPLLPEAVALPVDPDYLVRTAIVGATITVTQSRALGAAWSRYESDFRKFADLHWMKSGAQWEEGNFYDRAQIYYAWWVRTGELEYWRRATLMAVDYRDRYLERNSYRSSHHWAQLEGVALHYLLTGDERSRHAVAQTSEGLASYFKRGQLDNIDHRDMESRIQARSLLAALLAWDLRVGDDHGGTWAERLPRIVSQILHVQRSDGSFLWGSVCNNSLNYMNALLNDALIRYYSTFKRDSTIAESIRRNSDWLWSHEWRERDQSFNYQSGYCASNRSGPSPSRDLLGLYVTTYSWLYWYTRDDRYRERADRIFSASTRGAYLTGSKQFNQQYYSSYRYLAYRHGEDGGH